MDYYGFYTGKVFDAYRYLGAHAEREGVTFRTFAPSAQRISLIGEFSSWEDVPCTRSMMATSGNVTSRMPGPA